MVTSRMPSIVPSAMGEKFARRVELCVNLLLCEVKAKTVPGFVKLPPWVPSKVVPSKIDVLCDGAPQRPLQETVRLNASTSTSPSGVVGLPGILNVTRIVSPDCNSTACAGYVNPKRQTRAAAAPMTLRTIRNSALAGPGTEADEKSAAARARPAAKDLVLFTIWIP